MKNFIFVVQVLLLISFFSNAYAEEIKTGEKLPEITIKEKGIMTFDYEIKNNKMIYPEDIEINYRPWSTSELEGKVSTIYHLAARMGIEDINQPYIDALIKADLPDKLPDSDYKTTTILNLDDAAWGTSGLASSKFTKSQEEFPYAYYVADNNGTAAETWNLEKKNTAVIVIDKSNKVLFFKEGKLDDEDIKTAVSRIKEALKD
ncbi:MAG: YtfJ family protein [Thermodesulfobacteriota bacterium]